MDFAYSTLNSDIRPTVRDEYYAAFQLLNKDDEGSFCKAHFLSALEFVGCSCKWA